MTNSSYIKQALIKYLVLKEKDWPKYTIKNISMTPDQKKLVQERIKQVPKTNIEEWLAKNYQKDHIKILKEAQRLQNPTKPLPHTIKDYVLDDEQLAKEIDHALGKINFNGETLRYYGAIITKNVRKNTKEGQIIEKKKAHAIILENGQIISDLDPDFPYILKTKMTINNRWSLNSIRNFVENKIQPEHITHKLVYEKFKKFYDEAMVYELPHWYELDALWDMLTYYWDLTSHSLIIKHEGKSGSAKSKAGKISANLSFNGRRWIKPNPANFFRYRYKNKSTIIIDEAEHLFADKKQQKGDDDLVEYINASTEKGSYVPRQNPDSLSETQEFDPYGFTRIGSIKPLKHALKRRSITKNMVIAKKDDKRADLEIPTENNIEYQKARDLAYLNGLLNYKQFEKALQEIKNTYGLTNREWLQCKPIITLASLIDTDLAEKIAKFITERITIRDETEYDETSWSVILAKLIIQKTCQEKEIVFISNQDLKKEFLQNIGLQSMSTQTLSDEMAKIGLGDFGGKQSKDGGQRGYKLTFQNACDVVLRNGILRKTDILENTKNLSDLSVLSWKSAYTDDEIIKIISDKTTDKIEQGLSVSDKLTDKTKILEVMRVVEIMKTLEKTYPTGIDFYVIQHKTGMQEKQLEQELARLKSLGEVIEQKGLWRILR